MPEVLQKHIDFDDEVRSCKCCTESYIYPHLQEKVKEIKAKTVSSQNNKNPFGYSHNYIERIKISPSNLIVYNQFIGIKKNFDRSIQDKNLELSKEKKDLSSKAQRRLMAAMDWLLLITRKKYAMNLKKGKLFEYKLALLTLTLPSLQMHDDNYIKKYLLNEFLTRLRKDYGMQNYIWKAEKQQNGNIHFHIVVDKYMYFKDVNRIWNLICDNHGYIEKYREAQQNQHREGFTPRPELYDYWSYESQRKAYKKGIETNWCNPSSTSDIHSLRKVHNAKAYLSKYLTKNPDTNKYYYKKIKEYQTKNNCKNVPQNVIDEIKNFIEQKMHISGNLWYVCRNISKIKGCTSDVTDKIKYELNYLRKNFAHKFEHLERCLLIKINIHECLKLKLYSILSTFGNYLSSFRSLFYPKNLQEKYVLGIPLPIFET